MLPPGLSTPREVTLYYDALYERLINSGEAVPFLYPWAGVGAFLVIGYLLIDHRRSRLLKWLRFPVFAFLVVFQTWCLLRTRARHPAAAFGVGLLSAWGVLWTAVIMLLNDCQTDFRRIDRVPHESDVNTSQNDTAISTIAVESSSKTSQARHPLRWTSYPASLSARFDWVADVFCNFRGVGWNWQTSGVPSAPKWVEEQLRGQKTTGENVPVGPPAVSRTGIRRFESRAALVKECGMSVVVGYMVLDAIKTLMHHDAYFWGYTDTAAAPLYLPTFVRKSPGLLMAYRLLLFQAGLYFSLWEIFKLGPVVFSGVMGPRWLGVRGEAWMNPADMFGSFACVLDRGLAGWWSGWWHQVFRFGFEAPGRALLAGLGIDRRSPFGGTVATFVAFVLSGTLHASASYTQLGDTQPLMGPMRFFVLQACGIVVQVGATQWLRDDGVLQRLPQWVKRMANLVLVQAWLYFTAPLLMEDFCKGGVWLFEPVAISPLRGLGLGARDDTWWCWWDGLIRWRRGARFWDTGFAL